MSTNVTLQLLYGYRFVVAHQKFVLPDRLLHLLFRHLTKARKLLYISILRLALLQFLLSPTSILEVLGHQAAIRARVQLTIMPTDVILAPSTLVDPNQGLT